MINTEEILPRELSSRIPRRGKWTSEEERYTEKIIFDFENGTLDVPEGTTLRTFLSKILNCDPMRITKKYTGNSSIGKRTFTPLSRTPENILFVELSQQELRELRRIWVSKLMLMEQWNSRKLNMMKGMFSGNNQSTLINQHNYLQMGLNINSSMNSNTNSSSFGATTNSDDSGSHASNSSNENKPAGTSSVNGQQQSASTAAYRSKSQSHSSYPHANFTSYNATTNPFIASDRMNNAVLPGDSHGADNGSVHSNTSRFTYKLPNTIPYPASSSYAMNTFQRDYFVANQSFQEENLRATLGPYVPLDSEMDYIIKWLKTLFYVLVDRTISVTDLEHSLHVGSISMPALLAIFNSDCIANHPRLQQVHYSIQLYLNQRGINLKLPVAPLISLKGMALHNLKSSYDQVDSNNIVQVRVVDFNKVEKESSSLSDESVTKDDSEESKNKSASSDNLNCNSDTSSQADNSDGNSMSATGKNITEHSRSMSNSDTTNSESAMHTSNHNDTVVSGGSVPPPMMYSESTINNPTENYKEYENQMYSHLPMYAQNGSKFHDKTFFPYYHAAAAQSSKLNNDIHYPSYLNSVIHPINHTQYQTDLQMQHLYQQNIRAESLAAMASMAGYSSSGTHHHHHHPVGLTSSMLHATNGSSNFENKSVGMNLNDNHNNNANLLYMQPNPSLAASYMPPELLSYYMHQYNHQNWNAPPHTSKVPKIKRSQSNSKSDPNNSEQHSFKKPRKSRYNHMNEDSDYVNSSNSNSNIVVNSCNNNDSSGESSNVNNNQHSKSSYQNERNNMQFASNDFEYSNQYIQHVSENKQYNTTNSSNNELEHISNYNNKKDNYNNVNINESKNKLSDDKYTTKHIKVSVAAEALLGLIQNK